MLLMAGFFTNYCHSLISENKTFEVTEKKNNISKSICQKIDWQSALIHTQAQRLSSVQAFYP